MLELLLPVCEVVAGLDLSDPAGAKRALDEAIELGPLREAILAAEDLTPKAAGPNVRFGRLSKPCDRTHDLSIDVVEMSGRAAEHTHPNGEVSLCIALDGDPRFMGEPEGWVVVPPGSRHTPTVTAGQMRIVYFLPSGAMTWH